MNSSLKPFNTFGIQANATSVVIATSSQQLSEAWTAAANDKQFALILGEGSNILFLDDFAGTVILNRIKGIQVTEKDDAWKLHVGAGENWHHLVEYTLKHGMPGLENLALIPGCVGATPIQNIGAYGMEIKNVCEYVDCIELTTGRSLRLTNVECKFGYRDSIFKHEYQNLYAIVAVGYHLPKVWQPVISYGNLTKLDLATVKPQQIFDSVCHMRTSKLPDPKVSGNAGSFFKNPIISAEQAEALLSRFANAPHYPQPDGSVKLAAGWLIDQCQLKGHRIGGAAVHRHQALVIVNEGGATSGDVVALARYVRQRVGKEFDVWLEPEVRFIGKDGEVDGVDTIAWTMIIDSEVHQLSY